MLADYAARAHRLRRGTGERVTATQEAIDLSQALMVNIDAFIARIAGTCGLWPAYRSAPSDPEMEAELLSAGQWRDSAQEALVLAETLRDADARQMMREIAMHYENLAERIEYLSSRPRHAD